MKNIKYYVTLVIACILVFFPIIWHDFQTHWDDQWMVVNRYTEDGITMDNIRYVFKNFYNGQYGPINQLVYTSIYTFFGYNPAIFHLYSLLLHIINCCLLFMFLNYIVAGFKPQTKPSAIAFAATLLFAVHPLQVESVAWISASKIPLYTFFTLLALLSYIRFVSAQKTGFYLSSFLFFLCAFGSKEQSIVLPATLLLLDWVLRRNCIHAGSINWAPLILEKIPFILFALFAALFTQVNQSMEYSQVAGFPFGQRLVFTCYSLVIYAKRFLLPANLMYLYPFPISSGDDLPALYLIYPIVIATTLILLCIYIKKIPRPVIFGLLFYIINMALMLHIVPMNRFMITADRYVYFASAGLFFIASWYAVPWLQNIAPIRKKWMITIVAFYLLYLGSYAHIRSHAWKNSETLKRNFFEKIRQES